jgi:cytochrome P450
MTPPEPDVSYSHVLHGDGVYRDPQGYWVLSGYAVVRDALQNHRDFASGPSRLSQRVIQRRLPHRLGAFLSRLRVPGQQPASHIVSQPISTVQTRWLVNLDPPDHSPLRMRVSQVLTPTLVTRLRPRIAALANSLPERMT